jgi:peptidoglycan-N-acetylglucosamine deacetylase
MKLIKKKKNLFSILLLMAVFGYGSAWVAYRVVIPAHSREYNIPKEFKFSYIGEASYRWASHIDNSLPEVIRSGVKPSKKIALTFDDGPDPVVLPKLLRLLKLKRVKATFFFVGSQIQSYPSVVMQADRDGHQLGNHTFSHRRLTGLTVHQIMDELETVRTQIYRLTGKLTTVFRPPGGRLDQTSSEVIKNLKYSTVLWTNNGGDWRNEDSKIIFNRAKKVKGGGIVLLHGTNWQTLLALPELIDHLEDQGYELVTIDELMAEQKIKLASKP